VGRAFAHLFFWHYIPARSARNWAKNIMKTNCYVIFVRFKVLRSESPSGKCAKLHTVAASNNRDHPTKSLHYCLFVRRIWVLLFTHIPFVVNRTFNTTPTERLQQKYVVVLETFSCTFAALRRYPPFFDRFFESIFLYSYKN